LSQIPPARPDRNAFSALPRHHAFIGMGGNLGDVRANLLSALDGMTALPGTSVSAVSSLYRTRPVDAEGPDYLNAVAVLTSALGPEELLRAMQRLELQHDRERPFVNAPRTLDLDLLWYGGVHRQRPWLTLPHPRMMQRAFVLIPLAEVLDRMASEAAPNAASANAGHARQDPDDMLRASMPGVQARAAMSGQQGIENIGALRAGN
jgi:2-amino-4-hydroxy-6-hydroxymethyldihydropteridine diphosphokinase